jgi:hypothetical protein
VNGGDDYSGSGADAFVVSASNGNSDGSRGAERRASVGAWVGVASPAHAVDSGVVALPKPGHAVGGVVNDDGGGGTGSNGSHAPHSQSHPQSHPRSHPYPHTAHGHGHHVPQHIKVLFRGSLAKEADALNPLQSL